MKYHKINSIYKRDEKTKKFLSEYSIPEFEFLKDNIWEFTEKIDGTNVRIIWENGELRFGGKTDNSQMPVKLLKKLQTIFTEDKMQNVFPEPEGRIILYGEGFGAGIQTGGKYNPKEMDFILFDVLIGNYWLNRESVEDIAKKLNLKIVKVVGEGNLKTAVEMVTKGFNSEFGDFIAEGIVLRPKVQLFSRTGNRIITKVKYIDFQTKISL
jgi:hypothetical protein